MLNNEEDFVAIRDWSNYEKEYQSQIETPLWEELHVGYNKILEREMGAFLKEKTNE